MTLSKIIGTNSFNSSDNINIDNIYNGVMHINIEQKYSKNRNYSKVVENIKNVDNNTCRINFKHDNKISHVCKFKLFLVVLNFYVLLALYLILFKKIENKHEILLSIFIININKILMYITYVNNILIFSIYK